MRKQITIFIFVFILLAVAVSSALPVTTIVGSDQTYSIEVPPIQYLKAGREMKFHAHVFNSSGYFVDNTSTTCFVHLYNETGAHIFQGQMGFDSNLFEFDKTIPASNLSFTGQGAYVVFCNSSNGKGGFRAANAFLTESGEDETVQADSSAIAIVIFMLIITISLFVFSFKKEIVRNKYANIIIRRSFLVLGIYMLIFNSAVMATIAGSANLPLVQEMFFYMKVIGYMGYPAMVYLMFSALIQAFADMKQDKKKARTGDQDGEE